METISFTKPDLGEAEVRAVTLALRNGRLSGDGPVTKRLEKAMAADLDAARVFLTSSGTHALELAFRCLRLQPGDEVICPSFTFVSTANAILLCGGVPVFADIRPDTLNICPDDTAAKITPRTRAICPVHYAGVACDMDALESLADENGLAIIEDAAHAVGSRYKGRCLGAIGDIGAFSFHDTKNIVCGEGGAFVTGNEEYARLAEVIREKGTDRSRFMRGEVDKYTWQEPGSSYLLSEILAALLESQWNRRREINGRRVEVFWKYMAALSDLARNERIRLPRIPEGCEINGHIFYCVHPSPEDRDRSLAFLREKGIRASFHFVPLHNSPFARRSLGCDGLALPVTEAVADRLIRLPLYSTMTEAESDRVIEAYRDSLTR